MDLGSGEKGGDQGVDLSLGVVRLDQSSVYDLDLGGGDERADHAIDLSLSVSLGEDCVDCGLGGNC